MVTNKGIIMIFPRENDKRFQEILKGDFTLEKKSYQIYGYYSSFISYNRNPGRIQEEPGLSQLYILEELKRRELHNPDNGERITKAMIDEILGRR